MWIKICGNTRLEDCLFAAESGADAVGFVFAPGKRTVSAVQVAAITPHLPPTLEKIGVFTSRDADEIVQAAHDAGLTGVQLHGTYDPAFVSAVAGQLASRPGFRLIQVVHWDVERSAAEQADDFAGSCRVIEQDGTAHALLIDSRTQGASGGTGVPFDWSAAKLALSGLSLPVIVAGGLRPENVAEATRTLQPFGVDVSSGVELSPGSKDRFRVRQFVTNAREVSLQSQ